LPRLRQVSRSVDKFVTDLSRLRQISRSVDKFVVKQP